MTRQLRITTADISQHIIQRGINKSDWLIDNSDKTYFIALISEFANKYNVQIHSYVLMTNHIHLLVTPKSQGGVSFMMQAIGRKFVPYFNNKHFRSGALWEGRFRSCVVDTDNYYLAVSRYIELNPVRANMVICPEDYIWSSYHANALGVKSKLITNHPTYLGLGSTNESRYKAYKELFLNDLHSDTVQMIRRDLFSYSKK